MWAALALVLAAALVVLLGPVADGLLVYQDTERDLFRVIRFLDDPGSLGPGPEISFGASLRMHLGPAWIVLAAVPMAFHESPLSIHIFHVLVLVGGLVLFFLFLRRAVGPPSALAAVAALSASGYLYDSLHTLWHPGLAPGVVLAWFWLTHRAVVDTSHDRRLWALAGAWWAQCLLLQLHALTAAYAIPLGLVTLARLRMPARPAVLVAIGAAIAAPIVLYVPQLASVDWGAAATRRSELSGGGWTLQAGSARLLDITGLGPAEGRWAWFGGLVLLAAVAGAVRLGHRARTDAWPRVVLLTAASGLLLTVALTGPEAAPRYLHAAVIPLVVLAASGLAWLPMVARTPIAALVVVIVVVRAGFSWNTTPDDGLPLVDQQALVDYLGSDAVALDHSGFGGRLHGIPFVGEVAMRFLWATRTDPRSYAGSHHVTVLPRGFPTPAGATSRTVETPNRTVTVATHPAPRIVQLEGRMRDGGTCTLRPPVHCSMADDWDLSHHGLVAPGTGGCPLAPGLELTIPADSAPINLLLSGASVGRGEPPAQVPGAALYRSTWLGDLIVIQLAPSPTPRTFRLTDSSVCGFDTY